MRTNFVVDDELLQQAGQYGHAATKSGLVKEALKFFVDAHAGQERGKSWRVKYEALLPRLKKIKVKTPAVALLRQDRLGHRI